MQDIYTELINCIPKENVYKDEQMKKHTTFKIGGPADYFIRVNNVEDLIKILNISKNNNLPVTIIGNGSNVLVTDEGIRGIVIKPIFMDIKKDIKQDSVIYTVGSGVSIIALSMMALQDSCTGLEFASGIPGTVGGTIRMNAGCYGGQMQDVVLSTTYIDGKGEVHTINNNEHQFAYRESIFKNNKDYIIIESKIELKKGDKINIENKMNENNTSRKEKQPLDKPSAGSVFKRGEGYISAKLIDDCGLKGTTIGGAKVSEKHAGFIINNKNATAKDVLDLIKYIKEVVKEKTGIQIEEEIEILGEI